MITPISEGSSVPSKIEIIAVIGDTLPESLESFLLTSFFNWKYEDEHVSFQRVERVHTCDRMKVLSKFCQDNNLNLLILLGQDDKSYVDILKHSPDNTRVIVYLDNKNLAKKFIKNPSSEMFANWSSVAMGGSIAEEFEYSTNLHLNQVVAMGFSDWLMEVEKIEHLSRQIVPLDTDEFLDMSGCLIHKDCPLITKNGRIWTGAPNRFKGFELIRAKDNDWYLASSAYLQAAAGKDSLNSWIEDGIEFPECKVDIYRERGGKYFATIYERNESDDNLALMKTFIEQSTLNKLNEAREVACRISYTGKVIVDIPNLFVSSDYRCEGECYITNIDSNYSGKFSFDIEFKAIN